MAPSTSDGVDWPRTLVGLMVASVGLAPAVVERAMAAGAGVERAGVAVCLVGGAAAVEARAAVARTATVGETRGANASRSRYSLSHIGTKRTRIQAHRHRSLHLTPTSRTPNRIQGHVAVVEREPVV